MIFKLSISDNKPLLQCAQDHIRKDRIKGAIIGHGLGDALGAPVEFAPYAHYTGVLNTPIVRNSRAFGKQTSAVGLVTDDTEMAVALLRTLGEGYTKEKAVIEYMNWAGNRHGENIPGNAPFMGNNTRHLFTIPPKSKPSLKLYDSRVKKWFPDQASMDNSQSNGSLMRSYPLAFCPDSGLVATDSELTNPSALATNAVTAYVLAVRMAMAGATKEEIKQAIAGVLEHPVLAQAYDQACENIHRDVTVSRGHIVHAFYCAFWGLFNFGDYRTAIDAIISLSPEAGVAAKFCSPGKQTKVTCGDTDTNAAIAGALLGAYYGLSEMLKDSVTSGNVEVMTNCDSKQGDIHRPDRYMLNKKNIDKLTEIAVDLY